MSTGGLSSSRKKRLKRLRKKHGTLKVLEVLKVVIENNNMGEANRSGENTIRKDKEARLGHSNASHATKEYGIITEANRNVYECHTCSREYTDRYEGASPTRGHPPIIKNKRMTAIHARLKLLPRAYQATTGTQDKSGRKTDSKRSEHYIQTRIGTS